MNAGRGKRSLSLALAACAASLALAACGGDDGDSGDSGDSGGGDQFTTAEFQKTYDETLKDNAGGELLQVQITTGGTEYQIRDGEQATGLHFDPGSTDPQDLEVELIGTGTIEDTVFPIDEVDPAAIDKIVAEAPGASGASDFEVTVMTLARENVSGELKWTINGEGSGRTGLVLTANPDGSGLASPTGAVAGGGQTETSTGAVGGTDAPAPTTPSTTPPATPEQPGNPAAAAEEAQRVAECIQEAGGDIAKIQACAGAGQ